MTFGQHAVMFIATGGFVGYFPIGPGTMGSLVGLLFCLVFAAMPQTAALSGVLLLLLVAAWTAHRAAQLLGKKDPGCIVIDEIVGMVVAMLAIHVTWISLAAGFLLFRLFDIVKPFPVNWLDNHLEGGWGIVLDDVAAGLMANAVLRLAIFTWTGRG